MNSTPGRGRRSRPALVVRRRRVARPRGPRARRPDAGRSSPAARRRSRRSCPRPYWLVDGRASSPPAGRSADGRYARPLPRRAPQPRLKTAAEARGDPSPPCATSRGEITKLERKTTQAGAGAAPVRPHQPAPARRQTRAFRLLGARRDAGRRPAPVRREHTALTYPRTRLAPFLAQRHGRRAEADRRAGGGLPGVSTAPGRQVRHQPSTCCRSAPRGQRRQRFTDHHAIIPTAGAEPPAGQDERRRPPDLRHGPSGRFPGPSSTPEGRVRETPSPGDHGGRAHLPNPAGLIPWSLPVGWQRRFYGEEGRARGTRACDPTTTKGREPSLLPEARARARTCARSRSTFAEKRPKPGAALLRPRSLAPRRWRPPASFVEDEGAARGDERIPASAPRPTRGGDHRAPDRRRVRRARRALRSCARTRA